MKIAFCGYDFFSASLSELLTRGHDVLRVFTVACDNRIDFNQNIYELCAPRGIPVTEQRIDAAAIEQLRNEGCQLVIAAAYYYKIPPLPGPHIRGINVHPTLLPKGRGEMPLPWTILTQQERSGVTIHKLTDEYDAGDILAQQSVDLSANERIEVLSAKVQMIAKTLLPAVVDDFDRLWAQARPQQGDVSNWGRIARDQRSLRWDMTVADLDRLCRAFGKFGCFARFDGRDWLVYGLAGWQQAHGYPIGSVVHKTNTEMIVAAADGLVSLLYFRPIKPAA